MDTMMEAGRRASNPARGFILSHPALRADPTTP